MNSQDFSLCLPARPKITQQPQSQSVLDGEELRLECRARCKPGTPSFFWFRRNDPKSDWEPVIDSHSNMSVKISTYMYMDVATNERNFRNITCILSYVNIAVTSLSSNTSV